MNHDKLNTAVQIATLLALIGGFLLVTWELQLNKELAYGQILTDELSRINDRNLTLMSEDPRDALVKASLRPEELTETEMVTLHSYYSTVTLNWAGIRLTDTVGGLDRAALQTVVRNHTQIYFSSPVGRRWLRHWATTNNFSDSEIEQWALETIDQSEIDHFATYLAVMKPNEDDPQ